MGENLFERTVCRLCGDGGMHASSMSDEFGETRCEFRIENYGHASTLEGFAYASAGCTRFSIPVRFCPWCGKEL